ncbi:MAG: EAL domain-containing protein [Gammaproteobacteria bacterium]|nr:EAL domain-containing protein [Gammaproteobacteria bacterium]
MNTDGTQPPVSLLLADDDPAIGLLAQMGLTKHGYHVTAVESGEAALRAVADRRPDIILLDVIMPGVSGYDVCRRLGADPATRQIPIIMVTGLDDPESIEQAYAAGADAFVTKPINWTVLRHQLQYVLRSSRDRARLAESEERYALAASGANDGLWDWNIAGQAVYYSPRWREQLGLRSQDIGDDLDDWLDRIHPEDRLAFHNALNAHLAGNSRKFEIEYRIRDHAGDYRWMLCRALAIRDDDDNPCRMAGSQTDITERKLAERQLVHDALHDTLTGLANRKLLLERVSHAIKLSHRRQDYRFAVAIMDLDRFKNINDSLGPLAGDSLLGRIGERIASHLRSSDTLARIGGDEFAILFDDVGGHDHLDRLIERIRREISQPFTLLDQDVVTTASLGIVYSAPSYENPEDMLRDADIAMYQAKALGKNRHEVFDSTMHAQVSELLQVENELRAAIPQRQFRVFYQPIRRLADGEIVGFEALLRWQHPTRGLLAPQAFLSLAEETGLMIPIGQWTLREATRQLAQWHSEIPQIRDTYVSVNLSSAEFAHPDLIDHVRVALSESGLAADSLKLEVTETVLIENTAQSAKVLDELHAEGVATAIDDFGTGYSSFSYLHRFAFDALKIDRVFIHQIDRHDKSREIVRAIITLARNLGLAVIAEGGENSDEVSCLRDVGCEFGQGYAFAQALPVDEIGPLVRRKLAAHLSVVPNGHNS